MKIKNSKIILNISKMKYFWYEIFAIYSNYFRAWPMDGATCIII